MTTHTHGEDCWPLITCSQCKKTDYVLVLDITELPNGGFEALYECDCGNEEDGVDYQPTCGLEGDW